MKIIISSPYIRVFAIAILLVLVVGDLMAQISKRKVIWGINGHPVSQEAYMNSQAKFKNSIANQLDILKNLGFSWYRVDVPTDINGIVSDKQRYEELKKEAKKRGINILPIIYLRGLDDNQTTEQMYRVAYKCGRNFALNNMFSHLEMGNEQENHLLPPDGRASGINTTDYDLSKTKLLAAYFKGMINGVRSVRSSVKFIINGGWVHFGYFDLLIAEGVEFDIIGYHWYSDMGYLNKVRTYDFNIIDVLYKRFKKPIWITEINKRDGNNNNSDRDQIEWVSNAFKHVKANKRVQAMFVYELYDEPAFAPSTESNYGIIGWKVKYEQPFYKPIANTIKTLIKSR